MNWCDLGKRAVRAVSRSLLVVRESIEDDVAEWQARAAADGGVSPHVAAAAVASALGVAAEVAIGGPGSALVALGGHAATLAIATSAATAIARRRGLAPKRVLASVIDRAESAHLTAPYAAEVWRLAAGVRLRSRDGIVRALMIDAMKGVAVALVARGAGKRLLKAVPVAGAALRLCQAGRNVAESAALVAFVERHAEAMAPPVWIVVTQPTPTPVAEPEQLVA